MKAELHISLKEDLVENENEIPEIRLVLNIIIPNRQSIEICSYYVDSADLDKYLYYLGETLNFAGMWKSAIPGIMLMLDGKIFEFVPFQSAEVRKYINQTLLEF